MFSTRQYKIVIFSRIVGMKILLILQLLVGCLFIALDAESSPIVCEPESFDKTFSCFSDKYNIEVRNVNKVESAQKAFNLLTNPLEVPFENLSYDFDTFLNLLSSNQPTPSLGGWNLPTFTLIALENKGIKSIKGRPMNELIELSQEVHWQDFFYIDLLNRFEPQRHTGFYNSITNNVIFDSGDLKGREISDIQQWALHEFFGTANIDDKNYELSTFATLLKDDHLSVDEFNRMQYTHTKYQFPMKVTKEDYHPKVRLMAFPFEAHNRGEYLKRSGITGVEGGGDIVSASIKRYMLLALKEKMDQDQLKGEQVKALLDYDIHYTNFVLYSLPGHEDNMKTAPIYKGMDKGKPILVLKKAIRDE